MLNKKQREKVTFVIVWRFENDGDFFEQGFKATSASIAINNWRYTWGAHESDCVVFEVKKG